MTKDLYVVIFAMLILPFPIKYADRNSAATQIPSRQEANMSSDQQALLVRRVSYA